MGKVASMNPSTEEVYAELDESSDSEILEKAKIANYDREWGKFDINKRVEIVRKLAYLLAERKEELACIMAMEMGKPVKAGRHEIDITIKRVNDYCNMIPSFLEDEVLFEDDKEKNLVVFEPVGSVAVISPWNAPFFVPLAMIVPALLCGNNVIWKPSEYTSFCGLKLNKLFIRLRKFGFPENTFQIVIGGREIGRKLAESDINMIALTGSVRAGKDVIKTSSEGMKKVILELGGKDAAIVLDDADIDKAAKEIVKSSTIYTGQACFAVERVYCSDSVYEKFVGKCAEETKKLKVGNPLDEETDIGPFAVKFQMDKVLEHVSNAVAKGAKLLCGGERIRNKGYFIFPGVMIGVNHSMRIMTEETFGPITPIMRFDSIDEAIRLTNDSEYGLTASIWTSDLRKGEEIARKIEAGTVEVNRHGMSKAGCPWGGYKKSGIGRIYSKEGIREFCNIKHVWVVK